ncbi:transcription elongation regulator 1 [Labeo rohita]|uniref:Transcription elongation regulator 1 n=1 Tax=Labeo rohita TaxID=84645 RepID=A0A498LFW7_LABRO|nr:transcription elongation regulator 1 [Labeo rohita]
MVPNTSGLCRVGSSVPPVLISSRPPPVIQTVSGWQMSCDPFVPVMRAAAAEPSTISQFSLPSVQWEIPSRPHVLGFQPSASVDLLPVFPHVYRTVLPPHYGKGWVEKRVPDYKGFRNTYVKSCPVAIKRVGSSKRIALAAAAMMAMDSDVTQGPSVSSAHPLHLLSLSPIKLPFLTAPHAGTRSSWEGLLPILPSQITAVTSLTAPGVTLLTGNWKKQRATNKILELKKPSCTDALVLRRDPNPEAKAEDEPFKVSMDEDSALKDKRPVASTPIPGSPWINFTKSQCFAFFWAVQTLDHPDECDEGKNGSSHQMVLPLELRIGHFRDMLLERGVSAFSTWEKELHKIVFDPRYLLLSPEERKQIYDQFVKARMKEEHKEKKCKLQQAKEEYRKLLEESKITSRSTFKEFSEKYGKDPRFKQVQKRKDQELFFTQFISTLKKRDKENRIRLRKMR